MKIQSVEAKWLHVPLPVEKQHRSDFGRITAFDGVLVTVRTDDGAIGYGEAKPIATNPAAQDTQTNTMQVATAAVGEPQSP